jgi:hypothetical protein
MVRDRGHRLRRRPGAQRPTDEPRRGTDAAQRPELLISNSIFGFFRHGLIAAVYLGLAYAAKMAFGVSLALNAMK